MKILILMIGKTSEPYLKEGTEIFLKRIKNYISITTDVLPVSSIKDKRKAIAEESASIRMKLQPADFIVVLDENGKEFSSLQLSETFSKWMVRGIGRVIFVIGGPYGLSKELKEKANLLLSVSKFTFTHQMVRLILFEQIYRALTILRNENYHHD
jgi:23S rRNA (pseudouridine1915-N3)-methyltransferase